MMIANALVMYTVIRLMRRWSNVDVGQNKGQAIPSQIFQVVNIRASNVVHGQWRRNDLLSLSH